MTPLLIATTTAAAADDPVVVGREALQKGWSPYPWYDPASDSLRRVDLNPPRDWSWLEDLFGWFRGFNFSGGWSGASLFTWFVWGLLIVGLAVLVALLVMAYRRRDRAEVRGRSATQEDDAAADAARVEALPFPVETGPVNLLAEAQRAYDAGDFGRAALYLFSHQLVQLDKHHFIRLAKGKTNRQYLRELGGKRSLRQLVEQTMLVFEDVFFGNRIIDRSRFESCWFQLGRFGSLLAEEQA